MSDGRPGLPRSAFWLLALAFALAGPILALAPLAMAPLVIATAILATAAQRLRGRVWPRPPLSLALALGVLLFWCALSLAWDIDPAGGARKLVDIAAIWASLLALLGLADRLTAPQRDRLALGLAGGLAIGLILLVVETTFDYPLHRLVMGNANPRLVDLLESKRSVDALPLLVWPVSVGLSRLGLPWLAAALALTFAAACTRWTAASATLGMAAALVTLGISYLSPRLARGVLTIATLLAVTLVVPFAIVAYDHGAAESHLLKRSARHRMEIWHFAAEKILERPLFGHGFEASRVIPNDGAVSAFQAPDKPIIPLHPHDAFLQVWLELGAVGILVALVPALMALRAIDDWPPAPARFALAGYAAALVIGGLAFGLWQSWWMATLALSAATSSAFVGRNQNG